MITERKALWQQAFGDPEAFIDTFFAIAYDPARSNHICVDHTLAAVLYWFDCSCDGQKIAYLYAVATDVRYRGQGLCRRLLEKTHAELKTRGYSGCLLVPGSPELLQMYEKMGYRTCSYVQEVTCSAGSAMPLTRIDGAQYTALRRQYLPEGGVLQEGAAPEFLSAFADFYAGCGFVAAATVENNRAQIHELLGSADPAGVIAGLGAEKGTVRMPGNQIPFAMYHPLNNKPAPRYFGLAFD